MPMQNTPSLGASEHVVQFYESDTYLVESVCGFISAALEAGDGLLVCITDAHHQLIDAKLEAQGTSLRQASEGGQCLVLPTGSTLAQVMRDGSPSPGRFEEVVGGAVSQLAQSWPRVQAFGELVTVLCQEGNRDAACRLEELWNGLISKFPLSLLCAYPISDFAMRDGGVSVSQKCNCHSRVIPAESFTGLSAPEDQLRAVAAALSISPNPSTGRS